jgi:hypothetical protein
MARRMNGTRRDFLFLNVFFLSLSVFFFVRGLADNVNDMVAGIARCRCIALLSVDFETHFSPTLLKSTTNHPHPLLPF